MCIIWGTNYSIVKSAFAELDPLAFNAVRMLVASVLFVAVIAGVRLLRRPGTGEGPGAAPIASILSTPAPLTRRDWAALAGLGIVGHFLYQLCFIVGLALTSVANSSLILAMTPVAVGLFSALAGQERVGRMHWIGAVLSIGGIYLVVGPRGGGASLAGEGWRGDLLITGGVVCWGIYTVGARSLMAVHSPLAVTGLSMTIGTALFVPAVWPRLVAVDWSALRGGTWAAILYSAVFALFVSYTIWYAAVRALGGPRTAVYSNVVPLVAMATAVVWLGEPLDARKIAGALAVLLGVALTRIDRPPVPIPAQE
jgi:drug/metabolite transporter (DMT)-like permease